MTSLIFIAAIILLFELISRMRWELTEEAKEWLKDAWMEIEMFFYPVMAGSIVALVALTVMIKTGISPGIPEPQFIIAGISLCAGYAYYKLRWS